MNIEKCINEQLLSRAKDLTNRFPQIELLKFGPQDISRYLKVLQNCREKKAQTTPFDEEVKIP